MGVPRPGLRVLAAHLTVGRTRPHLRRDAQVRTYVLGVGSNRRYGDAITRQKDNARAEARALQPSSLPIDLVTTAGGPITQAEHPTPVTAYVEVGVTLIRVAGVASAWNSAASTSAGPAPTRNPQRRGSGPPPSLGARPKSQTSRLRARGCSPVGV